MTTIAANKTSIACDRQFNHSAGIKFKGKTKVTELSAEVSQSLFGVDKAFVGFCGNADVWGKVVGWLAAPQGKPPKCKDIEFLMLTSEGKIYHATDLTDWMEIEEEHFAIGSGMHLAIAAMDRGASPKEAVKVAHKYDRSTGPDVLSYKIKAVKTKGA